MKVMLTESDHKKMDLYLGRVLDAYKCGEIDKSKAVAELAHVMAALDVGNIGEVRAAFEQEPLSTDKR